MKSLKNILFFILSMLVFTTSVAQTCLFNDLVDDLVQQNSSFQAFVESEKGFRAWKILATEAPSLRTDMQELTLVLNNLELIENVGTKNYKSWKLLKEAGSKYVFKDKKLFEKFTKLSPEVQQYVAKFSDKDANSTLIKFLDDCEDAEFLKFINERPNLSEAFVGHKNSWTHTDFENIAENLTDISSVGVSALQKTQKWIDRSSDLAKFGKVTELGQSLNSKIVSALSNANSNLLKKFEKITGKNLSEYQIITELPLETSNGFMKADIVFVKYDDFSNVSDVIIIENKLSQSTAFTARQKEGFGAILQKGQHTMNVKYSLPNFNINKNDKLIISKDNIYRIYDHGKDNINNVNIEKITKIR